ncbi:hypothetical protein D5R81_14595 [Parashewanella spongiae]|uniref:Lipoprotein n=1 Tax=Parashewanella spongiae TaxID=342950 RepID=A0A3A6TK06_9GAMM|nr:hypothetical protein [Parashewanella spongiae]MCL1079307.1 hypothetical protein [Parashewanella spongiae]RJY10514.1 hypothetical protein D5R81_14595 [Parashewanella spongiae]
MKLAHYLLLSIAFMFSALSSACVVNKSRYSDTVKVHDEGYGNFLISMPTQVDSLPLKSVYVNVKEKEKDKNKFSVQGKLDVTTQKDRGYVHIRNSRSDTLEISVTVWHQAGKNCPIITVVQI